MPPYRSPAPPEGAAAAPVAGEASDTRSRFSLAIGALGLLAWVPSLLLGRPFGTQESLGALCTLFALLAR